MAEAAAVEARLRAFYARHNPRNDQNIAEIVRRFAGRELELSAKLKKKYGEDPALLAADAFDALSTAPPASTTATTVGGDSGASAAAYESNFKPFVAPASSTSPLDFRSESFDPLRALLSASALPGLEPTQPLDNLLKCRHLLPETDPHYQKLVVHVKKIAPEAAKSSAAKKSEATPSLFDRLADTYTDGPFTVLRRCFLERRRVVAVLRRVNSVRGTCAGYLKAFDKHMNLVLLDVDETFVPHETHARMQRDVRAGRLQAANALFSVAAPGRNRRFTSRQHSKQLFVRGDNVVMVFEERERRVA